jgi:hypothetical protein
MFAPLTALDNGLGRTLTAASNAFSLPARKLLRSSVPSAASRGARARRDTGELELAEILDDEPGWVRKLEIVLVDLLWR